MHTYHYAGNNPIKLTDPDGRITGIEEGVLIYAIGCLITAVVAAITVEKIQNANLSKPVRDINGNPIPIHQQSPVLNGYRMAPLDSSGNTGDSGGNSGNNGKPPIKPGDIATSIAATGTAIYILNEAIGIRNYGPQYNTEETNHGNKQSVQSQPAKQLKDRQQNQAQQTQSQQNQSIQVGPPNSGQNPVYSPDSIRKNEQNNRNDNNTQNRTTYPGLSF
jgi:hypothetical protein